MKNTIKIFFIFFLFLATSCSITKNIPEDSYLLRKNIVLENGKKVKDPTTLNYLQQNPNQWFMGIPIWLLIYNMADENSLNKYKNWIQKHPKTHHFLTKILSEKQVNRLGESFLISGKDRLLQNIGEKSAIIDPILTKKTSNILLAYYHSKGYFNAQTSLDFNPIANKKMANITYRINTGKLYYIDSISTQIQSQELDSVYKKHLNESLIRKGAPYTLENFANERIRLNNLFRNKGFYNFQQSAVNFDIQRDTDSLTTDYKINVTTKIDNFIDRESDNQSTKPYLIHKIGRIKVFTDYDFSNSNKQYDSIEYNNNVIFYFNKKLRFKRKMLYNAIAIKSGDIYSDNNRSNTYRQLSNLRVFRYPNIQYTYNSTEKNPVLNTNIYLSPLNRFSIETNTDITRSNIQSFGIGAGLSFLSRNIFKGAEILELSARGTIGSQKLLDDNTNFFNVFEYGSDIRLSIPRIWFFLKTDNIITQSMTPQTVLQFGFSSQKNIGLDRNKIQGILRYVWNPKIKNQSILELLDIEYTRNLNPEKFFSVYKNSYNYINDIAKEYKIDSKYLEQDGNLDPNIGIFNFIYDITSEKYPIDYQKLTSIRNIIERYYQLTRNDLIMASSFSFVSNNTLLYNEPDLSKFRVKVETAGNIPNLLSNIFKIPKNENGEKELFNVSYAQYIKTELEYIKHWDLGHKNTLAFRIFSGIAIPYGNAKRVPLSRSYFAGGSNDNRAWRAYSLGPGDSNSPLEFNEANFKFATNLEYRFPIKGAFQGAIFADAGNIWNVFNDVTYSNLKLDKLSDIQDIAIGTGAGIRYDFNYFLLRLDLGIKTYNPSLPFNNRWIKNLSLQEITFNIGINYPF